MPSLPAHIIPNEVVAAWERFYHLLGRGYAHIAEHPEVEAEILGTFMGMNTTSIEGTALEREYRAFPTIFVNFLEAYRRDHETVNLARMVEARYQDQSEQLELAVLVAEKQKQAVQSANERVSFLIREREKLVSRLAMFQTYFEHDSSDILLRLKCDWLQERIEFLTVDIAFERGVIGGLASAADHYEGYVTRLKGKCSRLFFKLADLESRSVWCRQSINYLEGQLSYFVTLIRGQFGFTFPPQ